MTNPADFGAAARPLFDAYSFAAPPARARPVRPPSPVPLEESLGTLGLLGVLRRNPLEAWTKAHFEQPIMLHDYLLGRVAIVSTPSAVRRVLLDNVQNYRKDDLQRRILGKVLQNGLLTSEGEQWRRQRRILAPLFPVRAVNDFLPAMHDAAVDLVERWRRADGFIVDVAAEMANVALDVLMRTIFTGGFGGDRDEWRLAMRNYFDTSGKFHPFDVLGLPTFVPRWRRRSHWSAFIDRCIDRLIAAQASGAAPTGGTDLLTRLLASRGAEDGKNLSEREIRANIFTFIAAGHETTANMLAWALYLLTLSPEWRAAVAAEAELAWSGPPAEMVERLVNTRAVIDEALRLYPPLAAISRVAIGPDRLAETAIDAGTLVVIAPYVLHRHRLLWEEPDYFDPNRFLPGAKPIDRYACLPFGAGPRVCIGATFALQEAVLVLSAIVLNFQFELVSQHVVWPQQRVTLRPRDGLPMRIEIRDRDKRPL